MKKTILRALWKKHLLLCLAMSLITSISVGLLIGGVSFSDSLESGLKKYLEDYGYTDITINLNAAYRSSSKDLEKLCGSVHHQGVVAMIEQPEIEPLTSDITDVWLHKKESALLLDRVGNANNLGAIVRSAAFFGCKNVIIPLDEAQSSVTTSSYRVAQGGMEYVHVYSVRSIARLLEAMKGKMMRFGTDVNAKQTVGNIKKLSNGKPALIVLGNEEHGISKEVKENCDELIIIPFTDNFDEKVERPIESLNVAQAAAIVLYEMRK